MLVRIVKNWRSPDLRRQTPGLSLRWGGIDFTLDPVEACDQVIVLNGSPRRVRVSCSPDRVWALMQEPATEAIRRMHRGPAAASRVYTSDPARRGERYVQAAPMVPWHVNRSYDELRDAPPPEKTERLSWVTSSLGLLRGHRLRMAFLERLRLEVRFDLFGRGFDPIRDKWDGLAPYRYSLAVENFSGPYYWTEKVADCFLAWTMPIYYGCTNLPDYFPPESYVAVDIRDRDAPAQVRSIIASDLWLRNRDAIAEARRLVLERHQLFPFLADEIVRFLAENGGHLRPPKEVRIDAWPDRPERLRRLLRRMRRQLAASVTRRPWQRYGRRPIR